MEPHIQPGRRLDHAQFARLLEFRVALRRFTRWSEAQASEAGLSHAQHQLLLAVCGHQGSKPATIGDLAEYLFVRHHSAVGLVDRAQAAGLVERVPDDDDQRLVRVVLTDAGRDRLEGLTELHLEELRRLAPVLDALVSEAGDAVSGAGDVRNEPTAEADVPEP